MTVANNYAPIRQLGNGATTQFSAAWSMISASYALVQLEDATTGVRTPVAQGVGANQYQISITSSGFTVTMGTAPTSSQYINVSRVTGLDQTNPYRTSKGFQGEVEENSFDKLTAMVQDARYTAGLAITIPSGETLTTVLPSASNRANKFLAFDASGNVIVSTLVTTGTLYSNITSIAPGFSDTNVIYQGTYSVNSYVQGVIQNTNAGATASADLVVANNLATATTFYGNFGMNSSGFTGSGSFNKANAVYLSATSGDLVVGTTTANAIRFVYNNGSTDSAFIDATGFNAPTANITNANITNMNGGQLAGFRNRIINGACLIDQRNVGAVMTSLAGAVGLYTIDRWQYYGQQAGKFNAQQSGLAPSGFYNSLVFTSTSAYTPLSSDLFNLYQPIEGYNVADLGWGSANAKAVMLSFWVKSSISGTHSGAIANGSSNRSYPFSFTINSINTWEYKTVAIPGDTTGTWNSTNGQGINVLFCLGAGSTFRGTAGSWSGSNFVGVTGAVDVVATNGANFAVTGVQFEAGTVATPFENRGFNTELALCQRYFEKSYPQTAVPGSTFSNAANIIMGGQETAGGNGWITVAFKATKRASPTITYYDAAGTAAAASGYNGTWNNGITTGTAIYAGDSGFQFQSSNAGYKYYSFQYKADAEL